jgi:subtilisin family serine protease
MSRLRFGAASLSVAVAAALAAVAPAHAAPAHGVTSSGSTAAVVSRHTVTLLTGDVVLLERTADGRQIATVQAPAGRQHISYQTRYANGHAYVIPSDAIGLLADGVLDRRVFDVTQLVADGYDDAHVSTTPLIVRYRPGRVRARAAPTIQGATARYTLESINATAVRADRDTFWEGLVGPAATDDRAVPNTLGATSAIERIWLDGKAQITLSESVPQIGAPQAWAAGFDGTGVKVAVLDTGIDETHPDLAGKVVAARNFSTDTDTIDHNGHGTHVASTVAGSGAASGGQRKGVAPGAQLINAKVLNAFGSGEFSAIIEGMEWSAEQGARIANMSLGTHSPSDGNDPLVQAVDEISRATGILFAIAADNIGPGESTITSPGWADEALTVGAVDKGDTLAGFSSRGPRLGDFGIKPDVTAPGVDIVAARADGSTLGPIVDGNYMQLSGTSMASPHVAGAAAIVAQQHPTYTNRQIKNLLVSTAKPGDLSVYQQGGGRVDLIRAHTQQVYADPGTLNLGYFTFPHTGQQPVGRTVTYRNDGATDVTLDLALALTGKRTGPATSGMFTVSPETVTVPARGEASVTVTVNPTAGALDLYGGYLVGTAGDVIVRTSVGAYIEPEMYNITVPALAKDGRQADGISQVELWGPTLGGFQTKFYRGGVTPTFRVPPGTYSLMGYIFTMDEPNLFALAATVVGEPQLRVTGDATVLLDGRRANRILPQTQEATAPVDIQLGYFRELDGFRFDSSFLMSSPIDEAYAASTATVTEGQFEFWHKWTLVAAPIVMGVVTPEEIPLDPLFMINSAPVDGRHRLSMVYAGFGRPEEYEGVDARGKLVLVSRGAGVLFVDKVRNAVNAGAAAVVIFNNVPGTLLAQAGNPGEVPIPAFTLTQQVGLSLVDLLSRGPVTIEFSGTALSPFEYSLLLPNPNRIADEQTYVIDRHNTAQVDVDYHGGETTITGTEIKHGLRPWTAFLFGFAKNLDHPRTRTEYVTAAPDVWWWHLAWASFPFDGGLVGQITSYNAGSRHEEAWFRQIQRPGVPIGLTGWEDAGAPAYREGDQFVVNLFPYVDPGQHYSEQFGGDVASTQLFQGDRLLAESGYAIGTYPALPGPATYRLVSREQRSAPWWTYSTDVTTTWTFGSAPASGRQLLPLLQIEYFLDLDLLNTAPDKRTYPITVDIGHQPGVTGPPITSADTWASFDDGVTWRRVKNIAFVTGEWLLLVPHPALADTSGAVSLRIAARDAAGNTIDQTIIRAYGLHSHSPGPAMN